MGKPTNQLVANAKKLAVPGTVAGAFVLGAAAFAALLSKRYVPKPQERVGVLVCGGNTDAVDFDRPR